MSELLSEAKTPELLNSQKKELMIKSKLYFDTTEPVETEHSISLIADFDGNEETLFDLSLIHI